jgi:hypothetical protein
LQRFRAVPAPNVDAVHHLHPAQMPLAARPVNAA